MVSEIPVGKTEIGKNKPACTNADTYRLAVFFRFFFPTPDCRGRFFNFFSRLRGRFFHFFPTFFPFFPFFSTYHFPASGLNRALKMVLVGHKGGKMRFFAPLHGRPTAAGHPRPRCWPEIMRNLSCKTDQKPGVKQLQT